MNKEKQILVKPVDAQKRLDIFLVEKLKISRSQVQKMIENEFVFVNNKNPKKSGDLINSGDKISIKNKGEIIKENKNKTKDEVPEKNKEKISLIPEIIAEEKDFLVVNKPSGLLTHGIKKGDQSLAEFLIKKYPEIKKVGEDPLRPGIVHRLDRETSGLLVVARNQKMFDHLKKQFQDRTIGKEYIVLVHDKVSADRGIIDFPLERGKNTDRMAALPKMVRGHENEQGKQSLTEFWVEKRFVNFSLLTVKIHTGRMHQIRAHFLAYDHPVVGDNLYFQKKQKRRWDDELGRLFLHSFKLEFTDLQGERKHCEIALPDELKDFLKKLK